MKGVSPMLCFLSVALLLGGGGPLATVSAETTFRNGLAVEESNSSVLLIQAKIRKLKKALKRTRKIASPVRKRAKKKRLKKQLRKLKKQFVAAIATSQPIIATASISTVPVGNVGNRTDAGNTREADSKGGVGHPYRIGSFEITNSEYVEFLNAVARTDTYSLYEPGMSSNVRAGILRSGSSPNFTYTTKSNWGNKPVNFISFWDACRFCNWVHNGCPTGVQDATTTEDGAYTLTASAMAENLVIRNPGARCALPTAHEWYKAAYHDPRSAAEGGPPGDDYFWLYPTHSDMAPTRATADSVGNINNDNSNIANYGAGATWNGFGGNLTTVGSGGPGSGSYYGPRDMGGNVIEWNETVRIAGPSHVRYYAGGAWGDSDSYLSSANAIWQFSVGDPENTNSTGLGFRVVLPFSDSSSFPVEMVSVPEAGNAADSTTYGSVADEYFIGKFEITNRQYTEFLNAVAGGDPNGLYHTSMGTDPRGGIMRSGSAPNFIYATRSNMAFKPVNFVNFWDACRFCNWLHNGRPVGSQTTATTENGAYDLTDGTAVTNNTVSREPDAVFSLPDENQWYKAAYYQPQAKGGPMNHYWTYPSRSDSSPAEATADATGRIDNDSANLANRNNHADWNGQDGNVTTVGSGGLGTVSFFGAADMGGNLQEWNEGKTVSTTRVVRGGGWDGVDGDLQSGSRAGVDPSGHFDNTGFRVARRSE